MLDCFDIKGKCFFQIPLLSLSFFRGLIVIKLVGILKFAFRCIFESIFEGFDDVCNFGWDLSLFRHIWLFKKNMQIYMFIKKSFQQFQAKVKSLHSVSKNKIAVIIAILKFVQILIFYIKIQQDQRLQKQIISNLNQKFFQAIEQNIRSQQPSQLKDNFSIYKKYHKKDTLKLQISTKYQQMNDFLFEVQKQMVLLKKKNLNILNQFRIQMLQARKTIQKRLINQQFNITQSNLMQTQKFKNGFNQNNSTINQDIIQNQTTQRYSNNTQKFSNKHEYIPSSNNTTVTKNLSTNYHSRNNQSKSNININPFGKLSDLKIKNHFNNNNLDSQNKQNINPNAKRLKTDISIIQEFPLKFSKVQYNQRHTTESDQPFQKQMKDLKVDQSILIPTQHVKNKYLKFRSPLSDNLFSAQSQIRGTANHDHVMSCSQFHHENTEFDSMNLNQNYQNQNQQNQQQFYKFGFTTIQQNRKKPSSISEKPQFEQNESLKNF